MASIELFDTVQTTLPEEYKQRTTEELIQRANEIKSKLGSRLFIPGHHYQKDEVIQFADATGDSLQLAQISAQNAEADYIVFCGVHFMAETADILTGEHQTVVLPDMRAGCSMADMANMEQTEKAWEQLVEHYGDTIVPLTYVNSTAEIKAFVGKHGGATVTSSNAKKMLQWAFKQKKRILFLPDQHLGRNTAYDLGITLEDMVVWNPIQNNFEGNPHEDVKMILWKGHCSVHENFRIEHVEQLRKEEPDRQILVHPECTHDVVRASDLDGSTKYIIETIKAAPAGSKWAIGTEMNLVNRLIQQHSDKDIVSLNPEMCPCLTMNRIDLPHFVWALEEIEKGTPMNVIRVDQSIAADGKLAIERMFEHV
ncbi:quinolinate synthase NadA [Evansella sp. AB-P1]|uniref:quinolinate synthase NadA n=1 Tax=Evansella sp. AB-P1 TaxID=3037653 RepID=UPI0024202756|nr:quinolinate synthase NadA [Evansella sp. AB-P1]MDG5786369.1 quinolinate synthase NadA [Evansella sp. AB-P1]